MTAVAFGAGQDSIGFLIGRVCDAITGKQLAGANVAVDNTDRGNLTDSAGRYAISMPAGRYGLTTAEVGYIDARDSAKVAPGETTVVSFRLVSQQRMDDSIMATIAGIRFTALRGDGVARQSKDIAYNNSVMVKAWQTYLKGKGRFGIRRVTHEQSDVGPGFVIRRYLIVENGTCRVVVVWEDSHFGRLIQATGHSYPKLKLLQSRIRNPNTGDHVTTQFNGIPPSDHELLFQFLDDSGHELGIF